MRLSVDSEGSDLLCIIAGPGSLYCAALRTLLMMEEMTASHRQLMTLFSHFSRLDSTE